MDERLSERATAAVLRAWIEADPTHGLRVRVTDVIDLQTGVERIHPVVSSIDAVCAIVRAWLTEFVESAPSPSPPPEELTETPGSDPTVTPP